MIAGRWCLTVLLAASFTARGVGGQPSLEKQRCPKPREFAVVFSLGYGSDLLPADEERFDRLLGMVKAAGFNVVQCTYTDKRLAACKKHGVRMMVDLQSADHHHVYKSPEKAKAVCEKLRCNPTVWGYSIWNDPIRKSYRGRQSNILSVREWDPTHPAYCGTSGTDGMRHITNADVIGYYDFHWKRRPAALYPHLLQYRQWASERDAYFYRWLEVDPGIVGKGNVNRCLHSANTLVACGGKGILWFLGSALLDAKTLTWSERGKEIARVNREIAPIAAELMSLGLPAAIHSTPVTRTLNDKPLPDGKTPVMPPGLEKNAIPADFFLQPSKGEVLLGVFRNDKGREVVHLVNHSAYVEQDVVARLTGRTKAERFNGRTKKWEPLEVKEGNVRLRLKAAAGELLRFEK